jgi:hypothetical protein
MVSQAGATWNTTPIGINSLGSSSFSTFFQFQITNPGGTAPADGIVFVIQSNGSSVMSSGTIGYGGIGNSVAVEFDTFNNGAGGGTSDPNNNHVGVDVNGSLVSLLTASPGGVVNCNAPVGLANCLANGDLWSAWIDYDGTNLMIAVADNSTTRPANLITYPINLGCVLAGGTAGGTGCPTPAATAYVGFTAGTSSGFENQDIVDWIFTTGYNPITPPTPPVTGTAAVGTPALSPWATGGLGALMAAMGAMVLRRRWGRA